jgi:C-terminal processing protease CtpA/Prc
MDEEEKNLANRNSLKFDDMLDPEKQEKYSFKQLNDSTGLLNLRIFNMANGDQDPAYRIFSNYLDSIFKVMRTGNRVKYLIVDVRSNPGGADPTYEKVFSYLTNHTFKENSSAYVSFVKLPFARYYDWDSPDGEFQEIQRNNLERWLKDGFTIYTHGNYYQNPKYNPVWYPDSNRFKGKIYLLVNEYTASAASHFASLVKGYSNATIVGVETAGGYYGHNGHVSVDYVLPNSKIKTEFSIVFLEQDAPKLPTQPFGRGVMPDFKVAQSLDDFLKNRDTQMDFVLNRIKNTR